jgi:hypothetical protein
MILNEVVNYKFSNHFQYYNFGWGYFSIRDHKWKILKYWIQIMKI